MNFRNNLAKAGYLNFADDIDSKLHVVRVPDINGKIRCSECLSYDRWIYVDHDYSNPESFQKEIKFRCDEWITELGIARRCDNDITIYLDENNKPIFEKV